MNKAHETPVNARKRIANCMNVYQGMLLPVIE